MATRETARPMTDGQCSDFIARIRHYADGKAFEMTLDGDAAENQPIEMVRRDGYDKPSEWKHKGATVKGTQTRKFVWVSVGYQPNLDAVRAVCLEAAGKLGLNGRIPEGQWREAIKQMFHHLGQYIRGIADPSWEYPGGGIRFPYVGSDGRSCFYWGDYGYGEAWRWLVEVESK